MQTFYEKLQSDGFLLIPNAISIPPFHELRKDIDNLHKNMYAIFKLSNAKAKRFQSRILPKHKQLFTICEQVKQNLASKLPYHNADSPFLLMSLPDCPVQPAHSDLLPQKNTRRSKINQLACACVIAIMENTTLTLWKGVNNTNIESGPLVFPSVICLNVGDLLLFTGSQIHAGSAYKELNFRIHLYLDSPMQTHGEDETWRLDICAPKLNRVVELLQDVPENDFDGYVRVIASHYDNVFYELDSLTNEELLSFQGHKIYFASPNIQALQGNKNPFAPPHAHARRDDFPNSTKALWFRNPKTKEFHYYAFDLQNREVQQNPANSQKGICLFWILEKDPSSGLKWDELTQMSVIHETI